jgi:chromosomal replication initiation ATPase DnaA
MYIASSIKSNVRELEGALIRLAARSTPGMFVNESL